MAPFYKTDVVLFLAHLSRRLICELLEYTGISLPSVVCQNFQTTSPLKPRSRFFSYFTYSIYRSGERIIVFFCSGRIRTLVAMTTYSSHRLIMGKEEIDNFFCLIGDIWNIFLKKCLLSSALCFIRLLSKSLNLIGCQGGKKG